MRRKFLVGLSVLLVLGAVGAVWVVAQLRLRIETPFEALPDREVFVEVAPGDSSQTIATRLAAAGIVPDDWTFRLAVWQSGRARDLQAGEYRFFGPLSPMQVVEKLATGQVYLRTITFPEGLMFTEMADIFEARGFGEAERFVEAAQRVELIRDLDPEALNLEGYLFPETYSLPRDATALDLVEAMVAQFRLAFSEDLRRDAAMQERSVREVVTLASLIQKETGSHTEHDLVSAVYNNRLRIGMALQCDPTVIYALQLDGLYDGNLTRANLRYDSPYNTYRYGGLPPGPIAAPGRAPLEAALRPADASFLYFVSRNDGSHQFANTLTEHNRNVQRFQVEYFRARRNR